jgi:diguanylate cyclase (GGDEF)-like protein
MQLIDWLRQPPNRRLAGLEIAMVAVAALFLAAARIHGAPLRPSAGVGLAALTALFFAVEVVGLHFEWFGQAYTLSLSEAPLTIGLLCWPSPWLIAARVVGGAGALVMHRKQPPYKLVFNVCAQLLEATLALAVYQIVPGHGAASVISATPAAVAGVAFSSGLAMVCVAAAIRITAGRVDPAVLRSFAFTCLVALIVNPAIAVAIVCALRESILAIVPIGVAALAAGAVYRAYVRLRSRHASLGMLYEFTRAIGESATSEQGIRDLLMRTRTLLRSERAGLMLRSDTDSDRLSLRWVGPDGELHVDDYVTEAADWPLAMVMSAGLLRRLPRGERHSGHQQFLDRQRARDAILAPLQLESGGCGVLTVYDRMGDVSTYTDDDTKMFETVATHVANVLNNSRLVDRLRYESSHDTLTGLANRAHFRDRLAAALDAARPVVAVLLADLDRFKEINDTLGHHHGDLLLVEIARRITAVAPPHAVVARLGGDEFAVLAPGIGPTEAVSLAQSIREALASACVVDGLAVEVDASIGVAAAPIHGTDEAVLLKRADMAMYAAKSTGTGVEAYDQERDEYSPRRLALAAQLRSAIAQDQLHVFYQPQQSAAGEIVGFEALARWQHPDYGWVSPAEFIPLAEQSGAIADLTRWLLRATLDQQASWLAAGFDFAISVNVSMRNLVDAGIVDAVGQQLDRTGVPAERLTLEITESHLMTDPARTLPILRRLGAGGVRLSIDDFGTGYSSLGYLLQLDVQEIKIDKSFVLGLQQHDNRAIVQAVIGVATSLGLETVAEGVEDAETLDLLVALGCNRLQGYHVGRPMPADNVTRWLTERSLRMQPTG